MNCLLVKMAEIYIPQVYKFLRALLHEELNKKDLVVGSLQILPCFGIKIYPGIGQRLRNGKAGKTFAVPQYESHYV